MCTPVSTASFVRPVAVSRHFIRNTYHCCAALTQSNVDLRYYVVRDVIVI